MSAIEDSIKRIREKMQLACSRVGRDPQGVRLIAVTKTVDAGRIEAAASFGLADFGENYVQEAKRKIEGFQRDVRWHMIGHLQRNKVKYVARLFDYVHSIDRWALLEMLEGYGRDMSVLFELNLSGETTKHGATPDELKRMLEKAGTLSHVKPVGLMTMAPYFDNPEDARGQFRRLSEILQEVNREFGLAMTELSMGMSSDFEVAIEEGSTMVRVGTAIFGERS